MSKRQVTFYMDSELYEKFQKKYPNIASVFFRRCVIASLLSTEFFQKVFFETPDTISDN